MAHRPVFEAALVELHHSTDGHDIRAAASGVAAAAKEEGKVFARRCGGALEALLAALKRHGEEEDIVVALISAAGAVVEFPAFGDTSLAFDVLEAVLRTVDSLSLSATVQQRACEAMDLLLGPYDTWVTEETFAGGMTQFRCGAHNRVGYDGHGAPLRSQDSRAPALAAACCAAVRKALRTHATNPGVLSSGLAAISKLGVVQVVADALKEDGIVEELFGITRRLPSMAGDIEGSTLAIPVCVALSAAWRAAAGLWDSSAGVKQEVLDGALSLLTAFKTQPQELGGVFQLLWPVVESARWQPAVLTAVSANPGAEGAGGLVSRLAEARAFDECDEGTAENLAKAVVQIMDCNTSNHSLHCCLEAMFFIARRRGPAVLLENGALPRIYLADALCPFDSVFIAVKMPLAEMGLPYRNMLMLRLHRSAPGETCPTRGDADCREDHMPTPLLNVLLIRPAKGLFLADVMRRAPASLAALPSIPPDVLRRVSSHLALETVAMPPTAREDGMVVVEAVMNFYVEHHWVRLQFIRMLGVVWREWGGAPPPETAPSLLQRLLPFSIPCMAGSQKWSGLQRFLALRRVCRVRGEDAEGMAAEVVEPFGREVCLFL